MRRNSPLPQRGEEFGFDGVDLVDMAGEHQIEAETLRIFLERFKSGDDNRQFSGHVRQAITDIVDVHFKRHFL